MREPCREGIDTLEISILPGDGDGVGQKCHHPLYPVATPTTTLPRRHPPSLKAVACHRGGNNEKTPTGERCVAAPGGV